eukprot:jgi/Ulvmu1/8821/UM048_0077.1
MGSGCREVLDKLNRHWQTGVPFLRRNLCYNKRFDAQRSKEWPAVEVQLSIKPSRERRDGVVQHYTVCILAAVVTDSSSNPGPSCYAIHTATTCMAPLALYAETKQEANNIARRACLSNQASSGTAPVRLHVPQGLKRAKLLIAIVDGPLHAVTLLRSVSHGRPIQLDSSMFMANTAGRYKGTSFAAATLYPLTVGTPAEQPFGDPTVSGAAPRVPVNGSATADTPAKPLRRTATASLCSPHLQNTSHRLQHGKPPSSYKEGSTQAVLQAAPGGSDRRFNARGPKRTLTQPADFCCVIADPCLVDSAVLATMPPERRHSVAAPMRCCSSQRALLGIAEALHRPRGAFALRELRASAARLPGGLDQEPCRTMAYAAVPKQQHMQLTLKPIALRPSGVSGVAALPACTMTATITHGAAQAAGPPQPPAPAPQCLSVALTDSTDAIVAAVHTQGLRCALCGMYCTAAAALCAHVLACHRGARVGLDVSPDNPDDLSMRLMPGGSPALHDGLPRSRDSSQNYGVWVARRWRRSKPGQHTRLLASLHADCGENVYKIPAPIRALLPGAAESAEHGKQRPHFHVFKPKWISATAVPKARKQKQSTWVGLNAVGAHPGVLHSQVNVARPFVATSKRAPAAAEPGPLSRAAPRPTRPLVPAEAAPAERRPESGSADRRDGRGAGASVFAAGAPNAAAASPAAEQAAAWAQHVQHASAARERAQEHAEAVNKVLEQLNSQNIVSASHMAAAYQPPAPQSTAPPGAAPRPSPAADCVPGQARALTPPAVPRRNGITAEGRSPAAGGLPQHSVPVERPPLGSGPPNGCADIGFDAVLHALQTMQAASAHACCERAQHAASGLAPLLSASALAGHTSAAPVAAAFRQQRGPGALPPSPHRHHSAVPPRRAPADVPRFAAPAAAHSTESMAALCQQLQNDLLAAGLGSPAARSPSRQHAARSPSVPAVPLTRSPSAAQAPCSPHILGPQTARAASAPASLPQGIYAHALQALAEQRLQSPQQIMETLAQAASQRGATTPQRGQTAPPPSSHPASPLGSQPATPRSPQQPPAQQPPSESFSPLLAELLQVARQGPLPDPLRAILLELLLSSQSSPVRPAAAAEAAARSTCISMRGGAGRSSHASRVSYERSTLAAAPHGEQGASAPSGGTKRPLSDAFGGGGSSKSARTGSAGARATAAARGLPPRPHNDAAGASHSAALNASTGRRVLVQSTASTQLPSAARGAGDARAAPASQAPVQAPGQTQLCASSSSSDVVLVQGPSRPLATATSARSGAGGLSAPDAAMMSEFAKVPKPVLDKLEAVEPTARAGMFRRLCYVLKDGIARGHVWTAAELEREALAVYAAQVATGDGVARAGNAGERRSVQQPAVSPPQAELARAVPARPPAAPAAAPVTGQEDRPADRETIAAARTLTRMGSGGAGPSRAVGQRDAAGCSRGGVAGTDANMRTPEKAGRARPEADAGSDEDAALTATLAALLEAKSTPVPPRAQALLDRLQHHGIKFVAARRSPGRSPGGHNNATADAAAAATGATGPHSSPHHHPYGRSSHHAATARSRMLADGGAPQIFHHLAMVPLGAGSAITRSLLERVRASDATSGARRHSAQWTKQEHCMRAASPAALTYFAMWDAFRTRVGAGRDTIVPAILEGFIQRHRKKLSQTHLRQACVQHLHLLVKSRIISPTHVIHCLHTLNGTSVLAPRQSHAPDPPAAAAEDCAADAAAAAPASAPATAAAVAGATAAAPEATGACGAAAGTAAAQPAAAAPAAPPAAATAASAPAAAGAATHAAPGAGPAASAASADAEVAAGPARAPQPDPAPAQPADQAHSAEAPPAPEPHMPPAADLDAAAAVAGDTGGERDMRTPDRAAQPAAGQKATESPDSISVVAEDILVPLEALGCAAGRVHGRHSEGDVELLRVSPPRTHVADAPAPHDAGGAATDAQAPRTAGGTATLAPAGRDGRGVSAAAATTSTATTPQPSAAGSAGAVAPQSAAQPYTQPTVQRRPMPQGALRKPGGQSGAALASSLAGGPVSAAVPWSQSNGPGSTLRAAMRTGSSSQQGPRSHASDAGRAGEPRPGRRSVPTSPRPPAPPAPTTAAPAVPRPASAGAGAARSRSAGAAQAAAAATAVPTGDAAGAASRAAAQCATGSAAAGGVAATHKGRGCVPSSGRPAASADPAGNNVEGPANGEAAVAAPAPVGRTEEHGADENRRPGQHRGTIAAACGTSAHSRGSGAAVSGAKRTGANNAGRRGGSVRGDGASGAGAVCSQGGAGAHAERSGGSRDGQPTPNGTRRHPHASTDQRPSKRRRTAPAPAKAPPSAIVSTQGAAVSGSAAARQVAGASRDRTERSQASAGPPPGRLTAVEEAAEGGGSKKRGRGRWGLPGIAVTALEAALSAPLWPRSTAGDKAADGGVEAAAGETAAAADSAPIQGRTGNGRHSVRVSRRAGTVEPGAGAVSGCDG